MLPVAPMQQDAQKTTVEPIVITMFFAPQEICAITAKERIKKLAILHQERVANYKQ